MKPTAEERDKAMRKIPKAAMDWMMNKPVLNRIIYTKKGRHAECFCTTCGQTYSGNFRPTNPESYEAQFESLIDTPYHNYQSVCPYCKAEGLYKAAGKYRYGEKLETNAIIGQRMGEDFVFRIFNITRRVYPLTAYNQVIIDKKKSTVEITEYIRVFCQKGKKPQKDYYLHSYYAGTDEWYPHNVGGMGNVPFPWEAPIWTGTEAEIRKTPMYKYIPSPRSIDNLNHAHDIQYWIAAAQFYQDFELIAKADLAGLIKGMMWGTLHYRQNGKTPASRLGIKNNRIKDVIAGASISDIDIYRIEKQLNKSWNDDEIKAVKWFVNVFQMKKEILNQLLEYTTPVKFENYLKKQFERVNNDWSRRELYTEYIDYFQMKRAEGYDMHNSVYMYPKDLLRRHREIIALREKKTNKARLEYVHKMYPGIASRYEDLMDRYGAAAGGYIIRPAKSAEEIVEEGRKLHHCVGGDTYLAKHQKGTSTILFLRTIAEKDTPYITVEIKGTEILQWYGAYDKKPERDKMQAWLDTYIKELKKHERQAKRKTKPKQVTKTA